MGTNLRTIDIVCPACHAQQTVTEDKNGCETQCQQCGKRFLVRMADRQLKSWDTPTYAAAPAPSSKPEVPSFGRKMRGQLLICTAMLVIVAALAVFSLFYAPKTAENTEGGTLAPTAASVAAEQNRFGEKLLDGIGVATDVPRAIELFREAAKAGNMDALCNLAHCHLIGKGVERSPESAFELYSQAARAGNFVAQNAVGELLDAGVGTPRQMEEAIQWYRRAAKQEYAPAQFNLGVCYAEGTGVDKDLATAVDYYRAAAKHGYAPALNNLGVCYAKGWGVGRDENRAANLFFRAASEGSIEGKFNCGAACYTGCGRKKDVPQGFRFFRDAAERGCVPAQYNLAVYYENAIVVRKNPSRARFWYRRAWEGGDERAGKALLEISGK